MKDLAKLQRLHDTNKQAEYQTREVKVGDTVETFTFKRLPYLEVDRLRLAGSNDTGGFDPKKFAGNNGRWVAATLVDDETHEPLCTVDEVAMWDTSVVDALASAATDVNSVNRGATEVIAKNSDARPSDEPSAISQ